MRMFRLRQRVAIVMLASTALAGAGAFAASDAAASASNSHAVEFQDSTGSVDCGVTSLSEFGKKPALICGDSKGFLRLRTTGKATLVKWHKPFSPLGGQPPVTLHSGTKWSWHAIVCVLASTTVTCTNAQRKGFTTSGKTYTLF